MNVLRQRRTRPVGEVNIAPLIDMTFILLIFFMVSTTFVRDMQLDLERPGAKSAAQADQRTIRVTVDRFGNIFVDTRPVKSWMLQGRVREHLAKSSLKSVLVVSDARVHTGKLVQIVDQCRMAGATQVGVAVDQEL